MAAVSPAAPVPSTTTSKTSGSIALSSMAAPHRATRRRRHACLLGGMYTRGDEPLHELPPHPADAGPGTSTALLQGRPDLRIRCPRTCRGGTDHECERGGTTPLRHRHKGEGTIVHKRSRALCSLALVGAFALVAAACGDDDDSAPEATGGATTGAVTTPAGPATSGVA